MWKFPKIRNVVDLGKIWTRKKKNSLKHSFLAVKSAKPTPEGKTMYMLAKLMANLAISNLNCIKVRVFFEHLCYHDKNYYYYWKSNIPVINLIVDSRNMSKFQKMWVCKKLDKRRESFSPNTNNFLTLFIVFEWGRILESAMDK